MRCFACLEKGRCHNEEHILSSALGAELTTDAFCADCNSLFGREIDGPFVRYRWIQELRARYGIADRYGVVPSPPRVPATVDGVRAVVTMGTPWTIETFPEDEIVDDSFRFTVRADQEDEIVAKKLERLRRRYGAVVEVGSRAPVPNDPLTAQFSETLSVDFWPRFAAKVTLGVASLLPDRWAWRYSRQGRYIAEVAQEGNRETRDGEIPLQTIARVLPADHLLARLAPTPAHLIWIEESGRFLAGTVFGQHLFGAAFGDTPPGRNTGWLFDPQARTVRSARWGELIATMTIGLRQAS
jgi:hypothetical protein